MGEEQPLQQVQFAEALPDRGFVVFKLEKAFAIHSGAFGTGATPTKEQGSSAPDSTVPFSSALTTQGEDTKLQLVFPEKQVALFRSNYFSSR